LDRPLYTVSENNLELDGAIIRLKELGRNITITDLLERGNLELIIEMLQIIERMNIPLRMGEEGIA
jgi:hypothetical protein